jgi:hypothetical protein
MVQKIVTSTGKANNHPPRIRRQAAHSFFFLETILMTNHPNSFSICTLLPHYTTGFDLRTRNYHLEQRAPKMVVKGMRNLIK